MQAGKPGNTLSGVKKEIARNFGNVRFKQSIGRQALHPWVLATAGQRIGASQPFFLGWMKSSGLDL